MATPTPTPRSLPTSRPIRSNSTSQVRVVVRVRPFLPSELESKDKGPVPCISVVDADSDRRSGEEITVHIKDQWTSRNECYKLDSFFSQEDGLDGIFHGEVSNLISGIFRGFNATVFAYGATGSGKTYTMQGTDRQPGLIPLSMSRILSSCENSGSSIEIAYYEVYLDRCYDLLEPKAKEVMVLEDKDGQVQMKGLSRVTVRSMPEFSQIFASGVQRRKIAHTGLNDVSSRSHGVLSIIVSSGGAVGKLNLIDLAGNEDNRRTGNEGIRLLESAKINQSLFALSNVIYALNNNEPRIPYRETKLTRILQDSLGGTSRALMIACLNPMSYHEAVHTVSLAARSRHIANYVGPDPKQETPKVKVDMEAKLRAWLESKSKSKSVQMKNGPFSPISGRTASLSAKKPGSARPTSRVMVKDHGFAKGRKLFDFGVPVLPAQERCSLSSVSSVAGEPSQADVVAFSEKKSRHEEEAVASEEFSFSFTYDGRDGVKESSQEASSFEGHSTVNSEGQEASMINGHSSVPSLESSNSCNILDCNEGMKPFEEVPADPNNLQTGDSAGVDCFNLPTAMPDSSSDKENNTEVKWGKAAISPAASGGIRDVLSPVRRALSPVESNRSPIILLEPRTPKTPFEGRTPLERFTALSSKLKDSLVQEYLEFLNTASKEELLALKGIGQKRAEYILELREETPRPLKALNDLEKIGLSSKQVHNIFRGTARGIFG